MNFFVLLLVFRLVTSDKLDRTYLPPPGSKYAGGGDGDLDLPLEIPKDSYTTTGRPFQGQKGLILIDGTEPTIGINRGLGIPTVLPDYTSVTQAPRRPFNSIQNKFNVPTTTISYAFTQTTTLPPQEGFESTLNPTQLSDIEGQNFFGSDEKNYPQNIPGQKYLPEQTYDKFVNQQGFVNQPFGQHPGYRPSVQGQQNVFGRPGSQTQIVPPGYLPTNQQAGISTEGNLKKLDQNRPEIQIPIKQVSQPGYQNILGSQSTQSSQSGYRPGLRTLQGSNYDLDTSAPTRPTFIGQNKYSQPEFQNVTFNQQSYGVNTPSGVSTIPHISGTTIQPGYRPESPNQDREQIQYIGSQPPMNQQGFIQSTMSPQQTSNMQAFPPNQQTFDGRRPSIPSIVSPPQNQPEINRNNVPTQRPSQIPGSQFYSPTLSTQTSTTTGSPLYPTNTATQEFPTTQTSFPQYGIDGDKGRLPGSQQQFGLQRPTQAPSFQGTTSSGTSSGSGLGQSYNEKNLSGLTSPTTGSRPQFGKNQYENADEQFSEKFDNISRPEITGNQQNMYSPQATPSFISTIYPGQTTLGLTPEYGTTPKPVYGTTPTSVYPSPSSGTYQEVSAQANVGRPGIIPRPERPQAESDRSAVILNYENVLTPEGYAYSFDTSNGIHADESGTAIDGVRAQGSYSYIGDDGKEYSVIYSADENGFLPRGDHLPTPPPIPEAIQRVIEQAERDKEAGIYHDGSYDEAKYGYKKYMRTRSRPRPNQKGGTIVKGVDIPESSDDDDEKGQPSLLSPDKRPNFGQGQMKQDNDDHEFDSGSKKSQMKNRKPINQNTNQKPISKSTLEDNYDQEDITDEYGNVIKPIINKPSKQEILSKRPLAPGRTNNDFLVNKPDTLNGSEDYYDRRVEQDDTKVVLRPGQLLGKKPTLHKVEKSKPVASTSSYSEIISDDMNDNDFYNENQKLPETHSSVVIQKQFMRPSSSTSAYSEVSETQRPVEFAYDGIHKPVLQKYNEKTQRPKAPASSAYSEVNKQTPDELSNVRNSQSPKRPSVSTNAYSEVGSQTPEERLQQEEYVDEIKTEGISKLLESQKPIETVSGDKIYLTQKPEKPGTGYQYIPPQNKFIQDERNRFPTRFPEIQVTTDKPEIEEKTGKPSTAKPFMTPNVSRDEDDSYDDYDSNMSFKKKVAYETTKSSMTTDEYDQYLKTETDYENNPSVADESYFNENAPSITERPIKFGFVNVASAQRPTYPNQSTKGKPLFEEKTRQSIEKHPGQLDRNQYINEQIPYIKYEKMFGQKIGGSIKPESNYSITTRRPVKPTQKPNQYTTQPDEFYETTEAQTVDTTRQPGSYEEQIVTIDQRPGTRRPSQKPLFRPGEKPVTSTLRPGINIYQPVKSTTDYSDEDFTELEPNMIRSGLSKTPFSVTTESTGDLSTTVPDYDRTSLSSTTATPRIPGRPGTRIQNIPSTTYRPNYSVISGQQPTQISVDEFGRPITTDANQEYGTATSSPQFNIPSSTTRLPYNDRTKINLQNRYNQTFSPNEARFGKIDDKNINLGDETFESGDKQNVFRPQNQRPYGIQNQKFGFQSQSTTEKVIGEDFSGPKRPQGFDPKYGYYY